MTSTYSDLQSLRPADILEHLATRVDDYDPNRLGPDKGVVYTIYEFTGEPSQPGGEPIEPGVPIEPGQDAIELSALADDNSRRRFRIQVESLD